MFYNQRNIMSMILFLGKTVNSPNLLFCKQKLILKIIVDYYLNKSSMFEAFSKSI